jgi:hypothetical protein
MKSVKFSQITISYGGLPAESLIGVIAISVIQHDREVSNVCGDRNELTFNYFLCNLDLIQ